MVGGEHLAMILEQASDGVQRLCVPLLSGPYGEGVDLRLSRARGFVCSKGMVMTNLPRHPVYYLAGLFTCFHGFFPPECVPGKAAMH